MKILYSEFKKDYSTYTFSYVPYCIFEAIEDITEIYQGGFLPYSGNIELNHYLYYKARSVRINLAEFEMGSENRRVNRKFEDCIMMVNWISVKDFDRGGSDFLKFCTDYSRQRFKGGEMESDRLKYILHSPFLTDIIQFDVDGQRAGYVFISRNDDIIHYWYSFYELEGFQDLPLGKYMMMEVIRQSKEMGLQYCYLGTCYGTHSLYKVRDFKGVEFSDGSLWSQDTKHLKSLCKQDEDEMMFDRFKGMTEKEANEYINSLMEETAI